MSLQPIFVSPREVAFSPYRSSLKTDYAYNVSAITVYSISQFAVNKIILIGEYGSEGSEIIKTHASTAPTGFTVTLVSATTKPHPKDTPVYILSFDQIEFSHAATLAGSKSVLGSIMNIDPEGELMQYEDTVNSTGYYFTRYKNSITGVFSDYSDGIPATGMPENTVGYAIDRAMSDLGAKFSERLTWEKLIGDSREMLKLVRGKLKSWNKYKEFEQNFGTVSMGVRRIALPSAVYDQQSNKSILSLRVGSDLPLLPVDRSEYLQLTENAAYTEVATQGEIGATSLVLDDTSDMDDDGSVDVYVSGTKYTVTYTTNTRSTNTLSGIPASGTGSITATLTIDSQVWQDVEENPPQYFSVQDGYVYLWPMVTSDYEGRNLTGDYLLDIETIDSQMDVIDGPKREMLSHYLKWKIRSVTERSGMDDFKDADYVQFKEILQDALKTETLPESFSFRPAGRVIEGGRASNNRR